MPNGYSLNNLPYITPAGAGDGLFYGIWKLTRTLLAGGFRYRASGNGQSGGTKEVSNTTNAQLDLWGVDGAVHLQNASRGTGSGAGVSIGAAVAATGLSTITGVSGFTASSVGDYLTITGSGATGGPNTVTGTNNGNWRITAQTGTTVTIYAPGMIAETGNANLSTVEQYGGADGSITTYATPTGNTLINFTTGSFNGFTAADVGNYIVILNSGSGNNNAWYVAQFVSSNNVLLYAPPNATCTARAITASDAGNPTLQWCMFDPRQQQYPTYIQGANGQGAWWNFQGPSTLKIPLSTNVPTGTFIRGENITQTGTGAQGELIGIVTDTSGGLGYLVVNPRVYGTGGGVRGWNISGSTDTVTGALSGATITTPASTTPIEYISEWVIWKSTVTLGHIYHQKIDQNSATESATTATTGRFSTMANTLTQVTPQQAPASSAGSTPTTNGFPTTGTFTVMGDATNGTITTSAATWLAAGGPTQMGRFHCIAVNCAESNGVSQDGSWLHIQSSGIGYLTMVYSRMDNNEDGDLDPFIHQGNWSGTLNGAPNRTLDATGSGSGTDNANTGQTWISSTASHAWKGFRRRGLTGETYNWFSTAILQDFSAGVFPLSTNSGSPDQVSTAPNIQYVRDPVWVYLTPFTAQLASGRMRKGTLRWMQLVQGASANMTFDGLTWISLSNYTTSQIPFVVGPWDGVTIPTY